MVSQRCTSYFTGSEVPECNGVVVRWSSLSGYRSSALAYTAHVLAELGTLSTCRQLLVGSMKTADSVNRHMTTPLQSHASERVEQLQQCWDTVSPVTPSSPTHGIYVRPQKPISVAKGGSSPVILIACNIRFGMHISISGDDDSFDVELSAQCFR